MYKKVRLSNTFKAEFFERVDYYPHAQQLLFHESPARFRVLAAGARAGKSMSAGAEMAAMLMIPNVTVWSCAPVFELSEKEFFWTLELLSRYKLKNGRKLIDLARISNSTRGSKEIAFPWGSLLKTKSTLKTQTLLGEEIDLVVLGETSQLARSAWERFLRGRLGSREGQMIAPSTPSSDSGLFTDFYNRGKSKDPQYHDWFSVQFSTLENPTFSKEEWEVAKLELDTKVFAEQYEGKFVSLKGRVFPMFDDRVHVVDTLPDQFENWPVVRGIFHEKSAFNNPFICIFLAINPDTGKDFIVFDEIHEPQVLVSEKCEEIVNISRGKKVMTTVTDYYNINLQSTLKDNNIDITTNKEKKYSNKHAVVKRIQAIHNMLKVQEDKTCRLKIHSKCVNTIESFNKCKWPERKSEMSEMSESELPTTKFIGAPMAVSFAIAWIQAANNINIYEAQRIVYKKNEQDDYDKQVAKTWK